ncbi:hypothetical protein JOQ06_006883 [Pogonophryne albipinna]|uniref:Uncharacterized protein n=1 Tax=Pogonophryne albipinna TaxID=1090488 RepID=A0AAD6FHG9_9TELE|nr:hypothetical protein JOQ06_006883 [Pogonophryne albipinna]
MSKTKSKQDKDPSSSSASVTLAVLSSLLAEHRNAISADFKSSFEALTTTLDGLNSTVAGHGERIGSLEDNSNEVDRRLQHLENACSTLQQDNVHDQPRFFPNYLWMSLARRSFLHHLTSLLQEISHDLSSYAFQVKDLLIREACRRGELFYKEHNIRLYEDYSSDVLKERAEYKSSMAELYKRGYRPALLYPAKLRITLPNDEKTWIRSVLEADKFLQNLNK